MRAIPRVLARIALLAAMAAAVGGARLAGQATAPASATADALIREAIIARVGIGAAITIDDIDLPARPDLPSRFRQAWPDPTARLGHPIRFTLVPVHGPSIVAVVTAHVVTDYVLTARPIERNETMTADAIRIVHDELRDAPLRRLLTPAQVRGGRALRPMVAGAVILPGSVVVRRAVEPGDHVTVTAVSGDVRVSAELVAADGGNTGDVIRLVNPDTRKDLRGRIVKEGQVEVNYAR